MKNFLFIISFFALSLSGFAQIYNTTAAGSGPTNYATVSFTDSIYYYCGAGNNGELTALPPSGTPNWTFTWQQFSVASNAWIALSTTTNAASSTITSLAPGGYRVTITDATSAIVGCYRAWIVNVLTPTTVNVDPIPPGCGAVSLHGDIDWGSATPYYEPPAEPLLIDATTTITVCFRATHTWVSDLGFYLVAPASCGNTLIPLSPNPGSIGQNNICNGGDNVGTSGNELCFTTSAAPNLNVCTAAAPLTGTYDSYGPGSTPINWSPLYGCNAIQPGWAVQIFDCISSDVGALQHASITFTGTSACGDPVSITYDSGNINSTINDNSCSAGTASIYVVPVNPAVVVPYDTNFIWTAVPNITIPNNTTSLDPVVNPGPTQNTVFTLSVDTTGGAATIPAACGGNWQDSELYIYTPPIPAVLTAPTTVCSADAAFAIGTNVPGGFWTGTAVNPATGVFTPSSAPLGNNTIMYTVSNPCPINSFITINVVNGSSTAIIPTPPNVCENGSPITLTANPSGGTWTGTGITDGAAGTFDPSVSGDGIFLISYNSSGSCPSSGTVNVTVVNIEDATFTVPTNICANSPAFLLTPATAGGTWSGTGVNSTSGLFDPSVSNAGTWAITYTVGTCGATSTSNVVVNALPNVNATGDQGICPGENAQINATGALNYVWTPNSNLTSNTISNPIANPSSTQTYIVTGTDANGCSDTADVTITVFIPATITFTGGTQICEGDSLFITANNVVSNISWTPTATVSDPNSNFTYVFPSSNETYTVTGNDANGCAVSNSVNIIVNTVNASIIANPSSGTVPLTVDFDNTSSNGIIYNWNFGNGETETTNNLNSTQTIYGTEGTYIVTLTAISAAGCTDVTTVIINVYPECTVSVPNVFSPNGDGINDELGVNCSQTLTKMNMQIFDRWGKKVIELTDPTQTWDGGDNSEGTYYYVLSAEAFNGVMHSLNGFITLSK